VPTGPQMEWNEENDMPLWKSGGGGGWSPGFRPSTLSRAGGGSFSGSGPAYSGAYVGGGGSPIRKRQMSMLDALEQGPAGIPPERQMKNGGKVIPPGPFVAGEAGPERVSLKPDGTAKVTPLSERWRRRVPKSRQMASGGWIGGGLSRLLSKPDPNAPQAGEGWSQWAGRRFGMPTPGAGFSSQVRSAMQRRLGTQMGAAQNQAQQSAELFAGGDPSLAAYAATMGSMGAVGDYSRGLNEADMQDAQTKADFERTGFSNIMNQQFQGEWQDRLMRLQGKLQKDAQQKSFSIGPVGFTM
jgi:hypothetical protein